jgi:flagellar biosynthesis protein FlhG
MGMQTMGRDKPSKRTLADVVRIGAAEVRGEPVATSTGEAVPANSQAICVASGKGGTGKTIFSTNVGVLLAQAGHKVMLIDADLGLANSHLLLGLDPAHDVSQLISGERSIDEVLIEGPGGLRILPGGSGIAELTELNQGQLAYLAAQMKHVDEETDITLVDCSAGITPQVLRFVASAHHLVVVTMPEVTSMIDGYAVIKNVHKLRPDMPIWLVVNRIKEQGEEQDVFRKMQQVVRRRLGEVTMKLLGSLPHDRYVLRSVAVRQPVIKIHPRSYATACFARMADIIGTAHRRWRVRQEKSKEPAPAYFWSLAGRRHG